MRNLLIFAFCLSNFIYVSANDIIIQSTTSTRDSGLYEYLLPQYPGYNELNIKVIAVGTGQAIINAKNCDGDLLIVHDIKRELEFMRKGYGIQRHSLMFNDFVIVGPSKDPAKINNTTNPADAFLLIAKSKSKFISRSDSSGTHSAEILIWDKSKINPVPYSGEWYFESGQGMGPSLNIAIAKNAYIFTDRSSWLKYRNKRNHIILYEDKDKLKNEYGIILINYNRCKNINKSYAYDLYEWLISDTAKMYINSYMIDGSQVFYSN
ncbi:MAG: substrate-binding domain-containing protein [Gammaproteobacteria bacterium]|tara:strand:- start:43 stop:837 length:795 start_codon:yes stop_codon:yes gene_type:complete